MVHKSEGGWRLIIDFGYLNRESIDKDSTGEYALSDSAMASTVGKDTNPTSQY